MVERIGQIGAFHGEVCARRRCIDHVRTAGPTRFSEALEAQNEEFRRARREAEVVARLLAAGIVRGVLGEAAGAKQPPAPPTRVGGTSEEPSVTCRTAAGSEAGASQGGSPAWPGPRIADRPPVDSPRVERVHRVTTYQTSLLKRGGIIDIVV